MLSGPIWLGGAESLTIYFYSPETNINNYRQLKEAFDAYLSVRGSFSFQPFSEKGIFEQTIADKKDGVFLLSSWHCRLLRDRLALEPVLVGRFRSKVTQKRILCADQSVENLDTLVGQRIASAGTLEYTRTLLREMLGEPQRHISESLDVLVVPKDLDAMMAVSFKMSRASIASETSLAAFAALNPKQHGMLVKLAESRETLLPIIALPAGSQSDHERLLGVLEGMAAGPEGLRLLKMLGLDALQPLSADEKLQLFK